MRSIILGVLILLTSQASALGVSIGPFALQLQGGVAFDRIATLDDQICRAIATQKLVEMVIEWKDVADSGDAKIVTKKVTIEPYLYGINSKGEPILKGNVVSENVLREVTIKYGDKEAEKKDGLLSGVFRSPSKDKESDTINLQRVAEIHVVEQSHFEAPKNYEEIFKGDIAQVICSIAEPKK